MGGNSEGKDRGIFPLPSQKDAPTLSKRLQILDQRQRRRGAASPEEASSSAVAENQKLAEPPTDTPLEPDTGMNNTERDARRFIAKVYAWTRRVGVNEKTVSDAEKEFMGKEIPELEALALSHPDNWQNIPERWLALARVLEGKYADRKG